MIGNNVMRSLKDFFTDGDDSDDEEGIKLSQYLGKMM